MNPISKTPAVGETLMYVNRQTGVRVPVTVRKVWAAACEVEVLSGGLNNSMKGRVLRAHVVQLYKV